MFEEFNEAFSKAEKEPSKSEFKEKIREAICINGPFELRSDLQSELWKIKYNFGDKAYKKAKDCLRTVYEEKGYWIDFKANDAEMRAAGKILISVRQKE